MAHLQHRMRRTATGIPFVIAIVLVAAMPQAAGQEIGDVAAGRQIAQTWCSSCHVIDPVSPIGRDNGAPAFASIARMSSTTPLSLRAFLQTPHGGMPDLHLSRDETDDLIGYILSLRRP